jgi:murein DD-endopeptidase MepM/ murein hydrolase activator NlpD
MKKRKLISLILIIIIVIGFVIPQNLKMPVEGAGSSDYNKDTFWYYPWGKSITHKGIDVFAKEGTNIHSSTNGLVLYVGYSEVGGHTILILGPKWRLHYYAHLNEIKTNSFSFTNQKQIIGTVGSKGNAVGKPPHLHYSIVTLIPYFWRIDDAPQGWKKMFFLNPLDYIAK